jgi:hypothetical protein
LFLFIKSKNINVGMIEDYSKDFVLFTELRRLAEMNVDRKLRNGWMDGWRKLFERERKSFCVKLIDRIIIGCAV